MKRKGPCWPPRTILIAVDTSTSASWLVDRATTLATALGARLVIAHAVCVSATDVPDSTTGLIEVLEGLDVAAHARLATWVRRAKSAGVQASAFVAHGEPLRVLRDAVRSEQVDLLMLGARRRGTLSRTLLGDLRADLIALGSCAVLALPVD